MSFPGIIILLLTADWAVQAARRPPPPTIDTMESVLMMQYVLLKDARREPSPELLDVIRDISRRRTTGGRTASHYEMDPALFRYILTANSLLYDPSRHNINLLSYLNQTCEQEPVVPAQHEDL